MKKTLCLCLALFIFMSCMSISGILTAAAEAPVVINNTWIAAPGEAIGVYGGNFGKSPVLMLLPLEEYKGETTPQGNMYKLPNLNVEDNLILSTIPEDINMGSYVLWVKTTAGISKPFFVNVAQVDWVTDTELVPTMTTTLVGHNLLNPKTGDAANSRVAFCEVGSDISYEGEVISATAYKAEITVPANIKPDKKYIIKYNNGAAEYGWAPLGEDNIVTVNKLTEKFQYVKDTFGLELGWAHGLKTETVVDVVKDGFMKGDGSDDSQGFINALKKMKSIKGGVLYFPKGTYNIQKIFGGSTYNAEKSEYQRAEANKEGYIPDDVIIMGESRKDTVIVTSECLQLETRYLSGKEETNPQRYGGIYNVTLKSPDIRPTDDTARRTGGWTGNILYLGGYNLHYFVKNVTAFSADGSAVHVNYAHQQIVIDECDFDITHQGPRVQGSVEAGATVRFTNNKVSNTQRSVLWLGEHTFCYNNILIGDNAGDKGESNGSQMEHRILESDGNELYFGECTITGTIGDKRDDGQSGSNCGEGICNQAQARLVFGNIEEATSNTLTDSDIDLSTPKNGNRSVVKAYVTVTYGKGIGQTRKITAVEGNTITLDKPWDIIPEKGAVYTIDVETATRYIIVNNDIQADVRKGGIMMYCKNRENIIAGNKMNQAGGIWFAKTQTTETDYDKSYGRCDFSYFNYTADNILTGGITPKIKPGKSNALFIGPGDDGGGTINADSKLPCTTQYGSVYKNNSMTGRGSNVLPKDGDSYNASYVNCNGICVAYSANNNPNMQFPVAQGMIVEKNMVTNSNNGVIVSGLCDNTLIINNDLKGNGKDYNDIGNKSTKTVKILPTDAQPKATALEVSNKPTNVNPDDLMPTPEFVSDEKVIKLVIDSTAAVVNGENVTLDVPAMVIEDRTLTPARFVAENLGAKVDWDEATKTVTITLEENTIILVIDSKVAIVNGVEKELDVPAMVIEDRTLTPARFVAENLGATVDWDEATKTVTITK